MKLEVGKWCRTKKGTIFKIIGGNVDMWEIDIDYSYLSKCENEDYNSYAYNKNNSLFEDLVVKDRFDIIDILEVGDYVNGKEVIEIYQAGNKFKGSSMYSFKEKTIELDNDNYETIPQDCLLTNEDIKSVITHEQMEQMAYKVGD